MTRGKTDRKHVISDLFSFLVLGVLAVFLTLLVMLGAQAYRTTVNKTNMHSNERILSTFLRSAVRADDETGIVSVVSMDDGDAVKFAYFVDDEVMEKWIYCNDGQLKELFTDAEYGFDPEAGERICDAVKMSAEMNGELLSVCITSEEGEDCRVDIALRTGGAM